ncbi:MAG: cation transporter [Oscillospiraceae bacterium]|nr:cation transporter [Oscillospiraceae bacterium]
MKTERNILIAFVLNLLFSVFEFAGGLLIGSVAIVSDAIHDIGDAMSIGIALLFERKSKRPPDRSHTYGYLRYSVLGSLFTTVILLLGSAAVIYNAVNRILCPTPIDYDGMILFAVIGVAVNLAAAIFTRDGDSLNQKAVNLHMLEDVLGWLVVLIGAIVMRFTNLAILDPILSIGVAVFILCHAAKNLKTIGDLFLEKTPKGIDVESVTEHLTRIEGVLDVHHIHIRSLDGMQHCATMHIRIRGDAHRIKDQVRHELAEHGIRHATLELEAEDEHCHEQTCRLQAAETHGHHHHHH